MLKDKTTTMLRKAAEGALESFRIELAVTRTLVEAESAKDPAMPSSLAFSLASHSINLARFSARYAALAEVLYALEVEGEIPRG